MMLVTINNKILNSKIFCWLSILHQNQQNFKITIKMIPLHGPAHHPEVQYFYLKVWYCSVLYYFSLWSKKKWFFDGKNLNFQNKKVENFKNLEILQSKRDFSNFLQAITFDTFMLANWNFLYVFYTGNTAGK